MELKGKYGTAIVYNENVEQEAISQIVNLLNQPMSKNASVRIMPDVHAGAGCVIGYTAKLTNKIVPNLIGVDIGCGVSAWKLGSRSKVGEKFEKLDKTIREYIPSGKEIGSDFSVDNLQKLYDLFFDDEHYNVFNNKVKEICKRTNQDYSYVMRSLGSLGGGNHFIEIDKDDNDCLWLLIHSGSRNFGLKVAKYHQQIAEDSILGMDKKTYDAKIEEIKRTKKGKGIEVAIKKLRNEAKKGKTTGLEYLEHEKAEEYLNDMQIAQKYAKFNRRNIGYKILKIMYKMDYFDPIESVHNYIDVENKIIRKGAISAMKDEVVMIPLNMADGTLHGIGLGNEEWNYSAPHGAGRKMSRSKAKSSIDLKDFQKVMKNNKVWSSSVNKSTLDESPQAYKKAENIMLYLEPTAKVLSHMKSIYNFKGE